MFSRLTSRLPTLALALVVVGMSACGSVASKGNGTDGSSAGAGGSAGASGTGGGTGTGGMPGAGGTSGNGGAGGSGAGGTTGAGGSGGSAGIVLRGAILPLSSAIVGGSTVKLTKQSLSLPAPTVCNSTTCLADSSLGL